MVGRLIPVKSTYMAVLALRLVLTLVALAASPADAQTDTPAPPPAHAGINHSDMIAPKTPMILAGYGNGGFTITTKVPQAQAFFDNGMQLAHAFAHTAAINAMKEAVRLDPACAMCLWGQAWAAGPTINFGKSSDEIAPLAKMADKAAALAGSSGTERERAMIEALRLRYRDGGGGKPGDLAFAKAMTVLVSRYPADDEVAVIAADAWLITRAENHDEFKLNAEMAMPLIETVLRRHPNDTPAIHFYIHATEIAGVPALAERYADRLVALAPRASHLVHMPSHTYYAIGRYQDAADVNVRAVQIGIDNAKALGLPPPDGVWGLPYHAHNVTYGLGGALEAGDAKTALELGRPLVERSQARTDAMPYAQLIAANGYFAIALFADPAEVLRLPQPKLPYLTAAWHYARGEAFARQRDIAGLKGEAAAIRDPAGAVNADDGSVQSRQLTFIARDVLAGRAAMMERRAADAVLLFRQAAELQESQEFSQVSDPPAWYYPVRRDVAAALLANGDKETARAELSKALAYRPKDPASLRLQKQM